MRPRQDEFDFLRETYEEMADALHLAKGLKRDVQAEKDRPNADSAQHVYLNTMKELFATMHTEHQSWSQREILKEALTGPLEGGKREREKAQTRSAQESKQHARFSLPSAHPNNQRTNNATVHTPPHGTSLPHCPQVSIASVGAGSGCIRRRLILFPSHARQR